MIMGGCRPSSPPSEENPQLTQASAETLPERRREEEEEEEEAERRERSSQTWAVVPQESGGGQDVGISRDLERYLFYSLP